MTWPAYQSRNAVAAFPVGVLLASEGADRTIRPHIIMGAVVGGIDDDRVFSNAQIIQQVKQLAHMMVMFPHTISIKIIMAFAFHFIADVSVVVHAGGVKPSEERLVVVDGSGDEVLGVLKEYIINRFHPLNS